MARPRIPRRIFFNPDVTYFKPRGIPLSSLQETVLTTDELEAVRLIDFQQTEQKKAAKKMQISQPTLSRLLSSARKKISDALINGKAIKIQGGDYTMAQTPVRAIGAGKGRMQGQFSAGPGGFCICPKCEFKISKQRGIPCTTQKCPKCQTQMIREM